MISKLFGNQNVKVRSELKSTRSVKQSARRKTANSDWGLGTLDCSNSIDNWGTEATDALKVPILAKAHTEHVLDREKIRIDSENASLNSPELDCAANTDEAIPCDNSSISLSTEVKTSSMGLYTKCSVYGEKMEKLLKGYNLEVDVFGPDCGARLSQINDCSAWIVDVSDESECKVLDTLLDHCDQVPALFFFEHGQTVASLDKLKGFIQQAGI